ncbi:phospholipase C [Streptomyces atratus]|uniref:Phospholipase C n=1 Tax=Streptomyces atratus TaxID=1893 RepID=A0A1K2F778_STRAR|nr:phospholipase C [Streptomyces atratus]
MALGAGVPAGAAMPAGTDNAVALTKGWYDFTVTIGGDTSWSRRYTGHIETGAASVSG